MNSNDFALVLEAFMWLVLASIPLLMAMISVSCWTRNRLHRLQHTQREETVMQLFETYMKTGQWPTAVTSDQRKALLILAQRMDMNAGVSQRG